MPRKILIVDDSSVDRAILLGILRDDYLVIEAENGEEAYSILHDNPYGFSAVVSDILMPVMDGYELVKKIRQSDSMSQIPVILITCDSYEDTMTNALICGANNFIAKPCAPALLLAMVKNNITLKETSAIINNEQKDRLTGVYNRETFIYEAGRLIQRQEAGYYVMSSFNINRFKVINDQYGTEMGDKVLEHLGSVFYEGLSTIEGICGRISNDRFAVLYPAKFQDSSEIEEIQSQSTRVEGLASPLSFCVGRYLITDLTLSPSTMYDRAELAGESIKTRYETRVAYYDEHFRESLINEQRIVSDMERALSAGEFEPWFQPQHNHSTGALIGSEALVRWKKDGKIIPPDKFIGIFEKNGFIYQVDKSVWHQVCSRLRSWIDEGRSPLPVSVNISRYDLFQKDFFDCICGLVKEYELPAELLRLEVTESAFSESPQQIIDIVSRLVEFGFIVEIDDFGSGYSSLNTLKDVPAQVIKLDMRFFESGNSLRGGNIVESIVRMAKWLGMAVIAEGIEKNEQADYLRSIGCDYIQGFLYARPMPSDQFEMHCNEHSKEDRLFCLETVENLDQNSFWDPNSMDTLIFNSFVGSACILEYSKGRIEMLRATKHYVEMLENPDLKIADVLALKWEDYLDSSSLCQFEKAAAESKETKETVYGEYVFLGLPGCPEKTVIRVGLRVIATSGDQWLIYSLNENITAQREAEEKEKQAAEQIQAILDNVDVGVVASINKNDLTEFMFANEKYYEILGYTREQFEAEIADPYITFAPEDRQRVKDLFFDCAKRGKPGIIEAHMLCRDGSKRLVRDAFSICHFAGINEPVHLSIFRDITDEHEAELREKRSAETVNLIMENVNCGICAIDMSNAEMPRFIFANEEFYSVAGYSKKQAETEVHNFINLIHPDDRKTFKDALEKLMTFKKPVTFDFRCIKRDGNMVFLNSNISFADLTGYGKVVISVQTDITDTVLSKQNAQQLANQLEVVINNTADAISAIAVIEGLPHLVFANDKYFEQLGVSKEEYATLYEGNTDYVHEEDSEKVAELLYHASSVGTQKSIEFRMKRPDGTIRWMRSSISSIDYPGVEEPVQLAVTGDVTEQVEAVHKELRLLADMQVMMADMPGGFARVLIKPDGTYEGTYCNEGFCSLVGMDFETLLESYGANPMGSVHPDDVVIVREAIARMQNKGKARSSRYRLLSASGEYVWVTVFGRLTQDQNGNSFLNLYYTDETLREKEAQERKH